MAEATVDPFEPYEPVDPTNSPTCRSGEPLTPEIAAPSVEQGVAVAA